MDQVLHAARSDAERIIAQFKTDTWPIRAQAYVQWFLAWMDIDTSSHTRTEIQELSRLSCDIERELRLNGRTANDIITKSIRQRIAARDGFICQYCGDAGTMTNGPDGTTWTVDHVMPLSKGGNTADDNLVLACKPCNSRKHANTVGWVPIRHREAA